MRTLSLGLVCALAAALPLAPAALSGLPALAQTPPPASMPGANVLKVDARATVSPVETGWLKIGANRSPGGDVLDANNLYLTLNGAPWTPVMGEIHFSRVPASEWDAALARIKASGVSIVATYIFWNHHQASPGQINWKGDRDLRAFVELAARHGLKVWVRLGPWCHGEARFGGIPDWVVQQYPTRTSDPGYLRVVERYWASMAGQLKGLMWKDGGPIVGVQIENEYNQSGPGQGRQHIADLKAIAVRLGFDVPFYTVTGWDRTIYPAGEVMPVFGGYPDEPWGVSLRMLPPKETYAFRFGSRVSGNLGAQTIGRGKGDAELDMEKTPFLGAEYGGGVPSMYRRRPLIDPDDIGAMLPVQLGSGVNLYGYYMYHGGRNLMDSGPLQEAAAIGGYNDTPTIEYDFQAPFGQYGETNPVAHFLRPFHYFLNAYGSQMAPMRVRKPEVTPAALDDLATPRFSVRSAGDQAFVFVNNYIRQYPMKAQADVRFDIALPGGNVVFPAQPVTIAPGAYFIWPINLKLDGHLLRHASAQPVTRIQGPDGPVHVFQASDGIAPAFAFGPGVQVRTSCGQVSRTKGGREVHRIQPGLGCELVLSQGQQPQVRLLVLTQAQVRQMWQLRLSGREHLVISEQDVTRSDGELQIRVRGRSSVSFAAYPALAPNARSSASLSSAPDGLFTRYTAKLDMPTLEPVWSMVRPAGKIGPVPMGGPTAKAMEPWPERFTVAGSWTIRLPDNLPAEADGAMLEIDWSGDIGRLFLGDEWIDDRYFDGRVWRVGLSRFGNLAGKDLTLTVLPLRADAPIYLDARAKPPLAEGEQIAQVKSVRLQPIGHLRIWAGQ